MNKAMMNPVGSLMELTVREMICVAGGLGEDPPLPKLTLIAILAVIGEEPPRPK